MSKNLLNYEGLQYFLSKLQTYIENQRTVKSVDTTASNGINLSNTNGILDVTVTPGSVADGDTGLVTGDAVYDAIQAQDAFIVNLTLVSSELQQDGTALQTLSTDKDTMEVWAAVNSGKQVYAVQKGSTLYSYANTYRLSSIETANGVGVFAYYSGISTSPIGSTIGEPEVTYLLQYGTQVLCKRVPLARLISPQFTGTPTAPTATSGTNTTQIATTEFVNAAASEAVTAKDFIVTITESNSVLSTNKTHSQILEAYNAGKNVYAIYNGYHYRICHPGLGVSLSSVINFAIIVPVDSNSIKVDFLSINSSNEVTSSYMGLMKSTYIVSTFAPKNNANLTGTPKAPTAELGTNNTQIATTAFVAQTVANAQIGKAAFQGTVDSQSDIPNVYKKGYHWLVQTAGTYFTQVCEIGDIIYCVADSDATHEASWSIEKDFTVIQNNLDIAIISNAEIDNLFTTESSNDSSNNG